MRRCCPGRLKRLWGFDGSQSGRIPQSGRPVATRGRVDFGCVRCKPGVLDGAAGEKRRCGSVRQSRPLSAVADEERTLHCGNRCR